MTAARELSWNMRHQLLLTRTEYALGRLYNPHYVVWAADVHGPLDLDRLATAWQGVQERHAGLMMAFDMSGPDAVAGGNPPSPLEVRRVADATDEQAVRQLQAAIRAPFDLTRGPLARLVAIPRGENRTLLAISVEHVVCDAWSQRLLVAEMWARYRGEDRDLPELKLGIGDHISAENEWLDSADGRRMVAERSRHLDGLGPLPELSLPGIRTPEDPLRLGETREVTFELDKGTTRRMQQRGAPLGLTAGALVHAALAATLAEMSGRDRVGIVLSTANRARAELRNTVGWVSNKIVVPTFLRHAPESTEYLRDFAQEQATALDYAAIPFGRMLHGMDPRLFGQPTSYPWVGYNPQPATLSRYFPDRTPPELTVTALSVPSGWNEKSLVGYATVRNGELHGSVAYKPFWYDESVAAAVRDHLTALCRSWIKES
jgi:condensation domain-containing protein